MSQRLRVAGRGVSLPVNTARRLVGALLDLIYPPTCGGCQRAGARFCERCLAEVHWLDAGPVCLRCGRPDPDGQLCARCRHSPPALDAVRSAALFVGPLREAIHAFKYSGRSDLAEPLAGLMAAFWQRCALPADCVVPVPLHPSRERERGFNQATLLARAFAAQTGLTLTVGGLERVRETPPQIGLSASERRANVRGAFRIGVGMLPGRRPLIVDDVCTTGATLEACAAPLIAAGCETVYALTLARARLQM